MKFLKRSLCVVLILILLIGTCAISSGAVLTDIEKIQYTTEVGVMNGMGIIQGRDDGSFDPKANVNRAEAAKMICYALIGKEAADGLKVTEAPFPDVPTNAWYAPYVSYLATLKVVCGFEDGYFYPDKDVTAIQLAKMLLVAVGYGQEGEYEGDSYTTQTYIDALGVGKKSIFYGTDKSMDITAPATREEAALYIYNAMCYIGKVSYRPSAILIGIGSEYVGLGQTMASARYGYVPEAMTLPYNGGNTVLTSTIIEGYITGNKITNSILEKDPKATDKTKDNYYDRTAITDNVLAAAPVTTLYRVDTDMTMFGHKVKLHLKETGKEVYFVEDLNKVDASITVNSKFLTRDYLKGLGFNGYNADATNTDPIALITVNSFGADTLGTVNIPNNSLSLLDNNENGRIDTVVYLDGVQLLNKITAYTEPTAQIAGTVSFQTPVNGKSTYTIPKTSSGDQCDIKLCEGLKKDCFVYVTTIGSPKVELANVVTGTMTSYNSSNVTINGLSYKIGAATTQTVAGGSITPLGITAVTGSTVSATKTYNFIFYANGKLAGSTDYNENTSYAVVLQTGAKGFENGADLSNVDASASMRLALADGTTAIYTIRLDNAQKKMDKATLVANLFTTPGIIPGTIIKFSASGTIINSFQNANADFGKITRGSAVVVDMLGATVSNVYFTQDTVFLYWKKTDTNYNVYKATGYEKASTADISYVVSNGKVIFAYADMEKTNDANTAFLKSASYGTMFDSKKQTNVYTYTLYVDGIAKTFSSESTYPVSSRTIVNYTLDDDGYITDMVALNPARIVKGTVDYADDTNIVVNAKDYYSAKAIIITIDKDGNVTPGGSVIGLSSDYTVACTIKTTEESKIILSYIYILDNYVIN